jgi:hypothetical protein
MTTEGGKKPMTRSDYGIDPMAGPLMAGLSQASSGYRNQHLIVGDATTEHGGTGSSLATKHFQNHNGVIHKKVRHFNFRLNKIQLAYTLYNNGSTRR